MNFFVWKVSSEKVQVQVGFQKGRRCKKVSKEENVQQAYGSRMKSKGEM